MTHLEAAKNKRITPLMQRLAFSEQISPALMRERIKRGEIVIPLNKNRKITRPCAIGKGLKTKINANIGTSTDESSLKDELKKLEVAINYGADTVMDLSVGGNLRKIRKEIVSRSSVPLGTVPVYELAVNAQNRGKNLLDFGYDEMIEVLESQARDGVDFFTIHAGVTRQSVAALARHRRIMGIVSRGGAILAGWMRHHKKENPFYEYFDTVLEVASAFDVTLSLGDGLRPGSILDATDIPQITELKILGELARRARKKNVQVIIEGPGHVPLHQIEKNIELEKKLCNGAPFYVLGPLVTDIAAGYDHISGAIGSAVAGAFGADFLCYLTPSEHLRHPSIEDVRDGVVASKIAAHAADIVKGVRGSLLQDRQMSQARRRRDWKEQLKLAIDPDKAREYRLSSRPEADDVCTMCGNYCSMKLMDSCG